MTTAEGGGGIGSEHGEPHQPPVLVRQLGAVAWLTINRPGEDNRLDASTVHALLATVETLAADLTVRALVLTGAGDRYFCAGAAPGARLSLDQLGAAGWSRLGHRLMDAVAALPQPTIAALNGHATGAGCELALACDLRLAAEHALIGLPDVLQGHIPCWGGTQRLPRLIGAGRAKELLYTGRQLGAADACACGLVNAVYPAGRLRAETQALAERLASQPALALEAIKQAVDSGADKPLADANQIEIAQFERSLAGDGAPEARRAAR